MTPIVWLIAGFALVGLSGMLESLGDAGVTPVERLPYYLPAMLALMGAPYCFFRAIRSGFSEIFGKQQGTARPASRTAKVRPARRLAEAGEDMPDSDFDADAAFARYMERRAAGQTAPGEPASGDPAPGAPAQNGQTGQPDATRPTFGRRVV